MNSEGSSEKIPDADKAMWKTIEFTDYADDWSDFNDIAYDMHEFLHNLDEQDRLPADVTVSVEVEFHDG